jgi:hypothetical protein
VRPYYTRINKKIEQERKTYISLLGKLHFAPGAPPEHLQTLFDLANEAYEGKIAAEASTRNTLTKVQNSLSKLLAAAGSLTASKDASEDIPIDNTEVAHEATEIGVSQVDVEDDGELDGDMTMDTKFTAAPDAEGTVFGDYDDDDDLGDDSDGTIKGDDLPVRVKREKSPVYEDESLLESSLDEDITIV